jgi:hypothetical protein
MDSVALQLWMGIEESHGVACCYCHLTPHPPRPSKLAHRVSAQMAFQRVGWSMGLCSAGEEDAAVEDVGGLGDWRA